MSIANNKATTSHAIRQNCIKELIRQRKETLQDQLINSKQSAVNRSRLEAELYILMHNKLMKDRVCGVDNSTLTCAFLIGDLSMVQRISRRHPHTESTCLNYAILHDVEFVKKAIQLGAKPNGQTEFYLELNPTAEITSLITELTTQEPINVNETFPWPHEFDFLNSLMPAGI